NATSTNPAGTSNPATNNQNGIAGNPAK
ncbi:MAG: Unknown protein, partial [uncultured Sulfurovum sp.]